MILSALPIRIIDGNDMLTEEMRAIYREKGIADEFMDLFEQVDAEVVKEVDNGLN